MVPLRMQAGGKRIGPFTKAGLGKEQASHVLFKKNPSFLGSRKTKSH
jgi:hypothetical protein